MAARRCSHCDRNHELDIFTCQSCGGHLNYSNLHDPDRPLGEAVLVDDPVEQWRLEQLLRAGYPADSAINLAATGDVDLHQAVELVAKGCPAETAARILL